MSEHKSNPTVVLQSMLPKLLPYGHAVAPQIMVDVSIGAGVGLYPEEHMRQLPDGKFEVHDFQDGKWGDEWQAVHPSVRGIHPIGKPLPPELCDVVIMLGTAVQDGMAVGIVAASGQPAKHNTSHAMHVELCRMPMALWQKMHLEQLRGPVE